LRSDFSNSAGCTVTAVERAPWLTARRAMWDERLGKCIVI